MLKLKKCLLISLIFLGFMHNTYAGEDNTTYIGSTIGAIAGGVLGYQFGGGTGQYVSTALGTLGGYFLGGRVQQRFQKQPEYKPEYSYQNEQFNYIGEDDYLIKQKMSDQAKRRNMIRNGEQDPLEMPYDISVVQTSWDDPNN